MPVDKTTFIQQAIDKLHSLADLKDPEAAHKEADEILVVALQAEGGYNELIDAWEALERWYA